MEQTIRIGDRVLVDKLTPWFGSKPQRGDVVVFKDPGGWLQQENPGQKDDAPIGVKQATELLTFIGLLPSDDEQDLIKRVIAVGGDTVKCCGEDGRVTVNGVPLAETYLHPDDRPSTISFEVEGPRRPALRDGDHRSDSADSRFHLDETDRGTVAEEEVVGRAVVIAWPFGHWSTLEERDAFRAVPDSRASKAAAGAPSNSVAPPDRDGMIRLPTPAELPLVMGVVGLRLMGRGQWHVLRSGCGDLAVGARSGHDEPEDRPERDESPAGGAAVPPEGEGDAPGGGEPRRPRSSAPSGWSCRCSSVSL